MRRIQASAWTKCGASSRGSSRYPKSAILPSHDHHYQTTLSLSAKGRLVGIQFDELFKDKLYQTIGEDAISYAKQIRLACKNAGLPFILKIQPIKSSVL